MVGHGLTASLLIGALIGSGAASLGTRSGCSMVASASFAVGCAAPSVAAFIAVCSSTGFDLGTNNLACANSVGVSSLRVTITRTPSLVMGHSLIAKP